MIICVSKGLNHISEHSLGFVVEKREQRKAWQGLKESEGWASDPYHVIQLFLHEFCSKIYFRESTLSVSCSSLKQLKWGFLKLRTKSTFGDNFMRAIFESRVISRRKILLNHQLSFKLNIFFYTCKQSYIKKAFSTKLKLENELKL